MRQYGYMLRCSCLCCIWVSLVWGMLGASLHTIIISVRIQNVYSVVNISTLISYLHNYTIMLEFVRVACKHNIKFRIILKRMHFFELILSFLIPFHTFQSVYVNAAANVDGLLMFMLLGKLAENRIMRSLRLMGAGEGDTNCCRSDFEKG